MTQAIAALAGAILLIISFVLACQPSISLAAGLFNFTGAILFFGALNHDRNT